MAINFVDGKYVDEKGIVKLDPAQYKDWQIAEEAEKTLPSVDFFREKLGLLPEEIIPYGKTPKILLLHNHLIFLALKQKTFKSSLVNLVQKWMNS